MQSAVAGARIKYMGNKVGLARDVAQAIAGVDTRRPLVDLFGGMCSVAGAVSKSGRRVWVNDVQQYARLVAECLLTSQDPPPQRNRATALLAPAYRQNLNALVRRFADELQHERRVLARSSRHEYASAQGAWQHVGTDPMIAREASRLRRRQSGPYRLATLTFAWGYFGLRQCIEIDSIRFAIDTARSSGDLTEDEAGWCRMALLQACSRVASSPGHFAQFLRGDSPASLHRIQAARRRSVWDITLHDIGNLRPYGTKRWRARNRVSTGDALTIWPELDLARIGKAVFYADPPYSKEQYSRFYHVLETLELYDYPEAVGAGRYRPNRFTTPLARKSGVLEATHSLCSAIAEREGILLLSYPSSGLLTGSLGIDVEGLLGEYFNTVDLVIDTMSQHSTLGGRHGRARHDVVEYVWMASSEN